MFNLLIVKSPNSKYLCYLSLANRDHFEFHEVKGYARGDAMVKVKVAARLFPWSRFVLVRLDKKTGWKKIEVF
jgi:hypothetical protein